ncbi:hypothetical protein [Roseibium sp.]|uniref:hypothetical protein n=1 Tax=Roseibium sp. TaxID=1936156 RepID=UPI003B5194DB
MNYSKSIFLLNEQVRAMNVCYNDGEKSYPFKTMDPSIEVDDLVIVPTDTRHGFTVCKVTEEDVEIDFDDHVQMKWIVGRVDLDAFEEVLAQEDKMIEAVKSAEKKKQRDELRKKLIADHEEKLQGLDIVNYGAAQLPAE